ncbi:phosphate ABC transporter membrane protein 1 (PhoT family) [Cytobacillus firmus]|uniref:Phosphate transport system permease protein n=2 Tax=Cytobacillus TaxID=2675230 RepID=A0A366JX94_CYTFI|nr:MULTISPECIES: phosphate ABC transporter permease subunit PstC [Cytobacillus]MCM3394119.1 phosphate ABC transporter permease subunit PstC [Cytobacillus oceanisediminis]MCS0823692.1 phosphate ABC transporter permease subunit PstC [Cytobacillus firmus]MDK7664325.1 phosphate ABC transporter permease subunit PstC [Cytobacillus oceanisediminis]RBP94136.1 phosphate ABC transporter membrane protein 1 (PhoT family) [Cytobacillus firmus]TDX47450.1 phosphate ABC transporter membrane protein 1 (PhoT fa
MRRLKGVLHLAKSAVQHDNKKLNVREIIQQKKKSRSVNNYTEKLIPKILFGIAAISVFTTIGIVLTLITETIAFFKDVPFIDFFTGTELKPLGENAVFGVLPLLTGTIISTLIAMLVAIPVGLMTAIFLSEYASEKTRKALKPLLEILAGIPTIVYGFFAFTFVTPLLRSFIPGLEPTNILSPGIVMGIMIIPMVASLSEDAMSSVPNAMREGALALGATKLEVTWKVVVPAAISGIIASFVLGISRAIGETMIVTIASGSSKNFTFDVTQSMQTMTAYIVEVTGGEAAAGTTLYYSLYAVAMTLFVFTLIMNLLAQYISRKFREEY